MRAPVSRTTPMDTTLLGDDSFSSIADIASNNRENLPAPVIKRFYNSIRSVAGTMEGTQGVDTISHPRTDLPQEQNGLIRAPVLQARRRANIVSYFALQEWEGCVTNVGSETFTTDLLDGTKLANHAQEQVEIPLEELGAEERRELRAGSIFRWTIGYEALPSGQRRRVSQLVFRQLPKWSQVDIDAANRLGHDRHRQIKWE